MLHRAVAPIVSNWWCVSHTRTGGYLLHLHVEGWQRTICLYLFYIMYLVYWEPNTMLLVKSLILAFFCGVHIDRTQKGRRWKCNPCVMLNFALPRPWGQGYEIQLGAEVVVVGGGGEKRWEGVHKALSWKQRYKSVVSGRKQDAERGRERRYRGSLCDKK